MTQVTASQARSRLEALLAERQDGLIVAMSGGVDSCTLAYLAQATLGDKALAVTLDAESTARVEIDTARRFAETHGLRHRLVDHSELSDPDYVKNDPLRCYHCRKTMGTELNALAEAEGFGTIAMGVVTDDYGEHRPGLRAAKEAGIWFPYVEAGISKATVRDLAAELGLEVADRPSNACLSSRIAYGLEVTEERLRQVEAAEQAVRDLTGADQVRVRHHGKIARIEVAPDRREDVLAKAEAITAALKEVGFSFVSMDLIGYRTGSMNAVLQEE